MILSIAPWAQYQLLVLRFSFLDDDDDVDDVDDYDDDGDDSDSDNSYADDELFVTPLPLELPQYWWQIMNNCCQSKRQSWYLIDWNQSSLVVTNISVVFVDTFTA